LQSILHSKMVIPKNILDSIGLLTSLLNMFGFKAIHQASGAPDLEIVST
jgi:hypothetical protein